MTAFDVYVHVGIAVTDALSVSVSVRVRVSISVKVRVRVSVSVVLAVVVVVIPQSTVQGHATHHFEYGQPSTRCATHLEAPLVNLSHPPLVNPVTPRDEDCESILF